MKTKVIKEIETLYQEVERDYNFETHSYETTGMVKICVGKFNNNAIWHTELKNNNNKQILTSYVNRNEFGFVKTLKNFFKTAPEEDINAWMEQHLFNESLKFLESQGANVERRNGYVVIKKNNQ